MQNLKNDVKAGRVPMRGVNLGGWLVAEYWMTSASPAWNGVPTNLANQGEYQTMKHLGITFESIFSTSLVQNFFFFIRSC